MRVSWLREDESLVTVTPSEGSTDGTQPLSPAFPSGRRYVTGFDENGRSCLVDVGSAPASVRWDQPASFMHDFWVVPSLPAPLLEAVNPAVGWQPANQPPVGGVIGRFITWAPGFHYPVHTTSTLDFMIMLSGQLEIGLDTGTQILQPGDVLVQRGTAHSWCNPGPDPCIFVSIMIDAATA